MDEPNLPPQRSTRPRNAPRAADASPPPLVRKRRAEDDARQITNSWVLIASRNDLMNLVVPELKRYCDGQEGIRLELSNNRKAPIKLDYVNAILAYVDALRCPQEVPPKRGNLVDEVAEGLASKRLRPSIDISTATQAELLGKLCVIRDLLAFCIDNNIDHSQSKRKADFVKAITAWRDMSHDSGEAMPTPDPTMKCANASKRSDFKGISVDFLIQYCTENDISSPTRQRKNLERVIIEANGHTLIDHQKAKPVVTLRPARTVEVRLYKCVNDDNHVASFVIPLDADEGLNLSTVAQAFGVDVCEIIYPGSFMCWHREVDQDVISKDELTMLAQEGHYRVVVRARKRIVHQQI